MTIRVRFDEVTDVLVVGSGLTGLMSAIAADETGASVSIVTPKRLGRDSSSAMSTGGLAASFEDHGDDSALHAADTLRSGQGVSDKRLVDLLCHGSSDAVRRARSLGGRFRQTADGELRFSRSSEHSWPRSLEAEHHMGTSYTVPMAEYLRRTDVRIAEFHVFEGLLLDDANNAVVGARLLDLRRGRRMAVRASAVVIATGGCGQLFPVTSNPIDLYGIGYSAALRAGAVLRDMEFIQFYPYRCVDPFSKSRVAIQPSTFIVGGKLYNSRNERFMLDEDPENAEATTRDIAARGIYKQITEGRDVNGGVRLDLSEVTRQALAETNYRVVRALERRAIDPQHYPFVIRPEAHYFMGGLEIDEQGGTTIDGLFAAGEAAGGLHGANRLTNNSLTDALVFGRRAGRFAADHAAQVRRVDSTGSASCVDTSPKPVSRPESLPGVRVKDLQETAWKSLGLIRDHASLAWGDEQFARFHSLHSCDVDLYERDRPRWLRIQSLIDSARLSLFAAQLRKESRGAHYRSDYPSMDKSPPSSIRLVGDKRGNCSELPTIRRHQSNEVKK